MITFVSLCVLTLSLLGLIGVATILIAKYRNEPNVVVPVTVILVVLFLCLLTSAKAAVEAARKLDDYYRQAPTK